MDNITESTDVHINLNPEVKERAMIVLDEIGISPSDLFNMLLNQVAIQRRIPFEMVTAEYLCDYGYLHDYSKMLPAREDEYHSFDSWEEAKEWLRA